jgi:hypothetical protein
MKYRQLAIFYYAKYFIPAENKLSIISNIRKFKNLDEILKILIYIFDKDNFDDNKLNKLVDIILNYQHDYFNLLVKLELANKKHIDSYHNIKNHPIIDKLTGLGALLHKIDKTKFNIFKNIDTSKKASNISSRKLTNSLKSNFKAYYEAYKEYEKIIDSISMEKKINHLHSANSFIAEFHQFFTHFSYAQLAQIKLIKDESNNFNYFIQTNYDRGIKHLQRATLDIYKVIIVILIKNKKLSSNDYLYLIEVRQFEINNISLSFNKKLKKYKSFLKILS